MHILFLQQIIKYGLIGIINTIITLLLIIALTYAGVNPFLANVIGFSAGLLNSFYMNKNYTFYKNSSKGSLINFLIAFVPSYILNILILYLTKDLAEYNIIVPQLLAMLSYNILFFALMKTWVFKNEK